VIVRVRLAIACAALYLLYEPFPVAVPFTLGCGGALLGWVLAATQGRRRIVIRWVAPALGWATAILCPSSPVLLALAAAAIVLLDSRSTREGREFLPGVALAACLLAAISVAEVIPETHRWLNLIDDAARSLLLWITGGSGGGVALSLRGSGLLVAATLLPTVPSRLGRVAAMTMGIVALGLAWRVCTAAGVGPQSLVFLAQAVPFAVVASFAIAGRSRRCDRAAWRRLAGATACAAVAGAVVAVWPAQPIRPRVATLTVGLQDHDVPVHGRYGSFSGGMFGLLPRYVGFAGGSYRKVGRGSLTDEGLRGIDVLLLINLNEQLAPEQIAAIRRFAESGGAVVVLADHTNVAGIQGPTNAVTAPLGIRVRFDSAKSKGRWSRAFSAPSAPWLAAISERSPFPYGVGASLELSGRAVPLLRGRHAFSDRGFRHNFPGAFLGNYQLEPTEEYGDIVIAAAAPAGRGWVYVFGDTTPFQNSALPLSFPRAVSEFLGCAPRGPRIALPILAALATLVVLVLGTLRLDPARSSLILGSTLAGTAMILAYLLVFRTPEISRPVGGESAAPIAVDLTVLPEDVGRATAPHLAKWSISRSLERNGWLRVATSRVDAGLLARSRLIVSVLPVGEVPAQDEILEWMRGGGHFFFCGGPLHAESIRTLLDAAQVEIEAAALGPRPRMRGARHSVERPFLPSAYRVRIAPGARATVLFQDEDGVYAVRLAVGRGSLTVVADDAWPYFDTIEGEQGWHIGNLTFLDRLWTSIADDARVNARRNDG